MSNLALMLTVIVLGGICSIFFLVYLGESKNTKVLKEENDLLRKNLINSERTQLQTASALERELMLKRVDTSSAKVKEMLEEIMSEVTKEAQTALKQMSHDVRETRDFKRSVKSSSSKEPVEATDFMKKE